MSGDAVGKMLLVGITYVDAAGDVIETQQYAGRIVSASDEGGVQIETAEGETMSFPPGLEPADPGEYRLRSTGEVIVDPDFVATWTVQAPTE